jgi:hypothetical protein
VRKQKQKILFVLGLFLREMFVSLQTAAPMCIHGDWCVVQAFSALVSLSQKADKN